MMTEEDFACSHAKPVLGTLQPVEAEAYLELVVDTRTRSPPHGFRTATIGCFRDLSKLFRSEPERIDHRLRP